MTCSAAELNDIFKLDFATSIDFGDNQEQIAFEHAIKIYINKPQVVNKWLAGSININSSLDEIKLDDQNKCLKSIIQRSKFDVEVKEFLSKSNKIFKNIKYLIISDFKLTNSVIFFPLHSNDTQELDSDAKYASINFVHSFQIDKSERKLKLFVNKSQMDSNEKFKLQVKWLSDTLLPKLHNWCLNVKANDDNFNCAKLNTLTLYETMVDDYSKLYQDLKQLYWSRFASGWFSLTNTDPEKYIHEDVSIACYFILAWRHLGFGKIQNFVDLGCGNGLLVYILNDQGYEGYGIDMRKRKIWSNEFYEKLNIKLIERTIDPKNDTFEDCDWLIGNHSDELSPWLPRIAYRSAQLSNSECNIMLIPCCFFDFNSKFDVKRNNESRFDTYLAYLSNIFEAFYFKIHRDKLRIPSTRNVCLIGLSEFSISVKNDQSKSKDENEILDSLKSNLSNTEFKARDLELEKAKSSRNCTKNVDNDLKIHILKRVLESLLDNRNSDCNLVQKYDGSEWNSGKSISLCDIASLFDKTQLNQLKLECGGIKTLLKNYHQLFKVDNKDKLRIKNPSLDSNEPRSNQRNRTKGKDSDKKAVYVKTKQCLFEQYHPNGCLLTHEECQFKH